jgi:glycogen synthase
MRIAFISYEYPPDTAFGGVATYTYHAACMLRDRGHQVEVFAGSTTRSGTEREADIIVHRVCEADHGAALLVIGRRFAERHALAPFDVLEGPELDAEPVTALRLVPDIPLVIKLHTPSWLLARLNRPPREPGSPLGRLRVGVETQLEGLRSLWPRVGRAMEHRGSHARHEDPERSLVGLADVITAPSHAVGEKVRLAWQLAPGSIHCVPNPYLPSAELLQAPIDTTTDVVTFIGRLEIRKGVLDLARAIPLILSRRPQTKFRLCGGDSCSPWPGVGMQEYLEESLLRDHRGSVQFLGHVASSGVAGLLAGTDVCVFPSIWENFPYVCLEAMAAGRGIVGTDTGGMAEMLAGGAGCLIPANRPQHLAEAVVALLQDCPGRMEMGARARRRVLTQYGGDRIAPLQEACYARAIEHRRSLGARRACA